MWKFIFWHSFIQNSIVFFFLPPTGAIWCSASLSSQFWICTGQLQLDHPVTLWEGFLCLRILTTYNTSTGTTSFWVLVVKFPFFSGLCWLDLNSRQMAIPLFSYPWGNILHGLEKFSMFRVGIAGRILAPFSGFFHFIVAYWGRKISHEFQSSYCT